MKFSILVKINTWAAVTAILLMPDFARQRIQTPVDTTAGLKYNRSMRTVIDRRMLSKLR